MGINAIALVLIAAFAVDRIVVGILFLLSYSHPWNRKFPEPEAVEEGAARRAVEKKRKIAYVVLAGVIGIPLSWFGQVRVLTSLGVQTKPLLDVFVTVLILMGASDRVADLLKMTSGKAEGGDRASSARPIEVKGTLTLEQPQATQIPPKS